jgi:hypothetical protein
VTQRVRVDRLIEIRPLAKTLSKPAIGAHARIRTGDLFLTKWSSVPGEFDLILARLVDFGRDLLTGRLHLFERVGFTSSAVVLPTWRAEGREHKHQRDDHKRNGSSYQPVVAVGKVEATWVLTNSLLVGDRLV